jgi:glycerate kinase
MKIVIAPDSFKGSLTALQAAEAMQEGIRRVDKSIETILVPIADGGEGTVQSLLNVSGGSIIELTVNDPLCRKIKSFYGITGDGKTAVIEMAAASGLTLLTPEERNPLHTSTYGFGELIRDALSRGCTDFILGLGGSATNDAGCGMASALGIRFLDIQGNLTGTTGGELSEIVSIDISHMDPRIRKAKFTAACDVVNPLCGKSGAAAVYARQKGADDGDILVLDNNLSHFADVVRDQLGSDIRDIPGAGAAGGLGGGVMAFLNAELESGFEIINRQTNLSSLMKDADLVMTGEGRIDDQTALGKAPFGVAQIASRMGIPVIAIAGILGENYQSLFKKGFDEIYSIICKPISVTEAMTNAYELVAATAENAIKLWITKKKKPNNS